jgi:hypothetical protein
MKTEKKDGKLYVEIEVWSWKTNTDPIKAASTSNKDLVEYFNNAYGVEPKYELLKFEYTL